MWPELKTANILYFLPKNDYIANNPGAERRSGQLEILTRQNNLDPRLLKVPGSSPKQGGDNGSAGSDPSPGSCRGRAMLFNACLK